MSKHAWALGALSFVTLLATAGEAHALRCGTRLVELGDTQIYVREICGEPTQEMTRTESRTRTVGTALVRGRLFATDSVTETVQVDTWIYDFGRTRFMEELVFENGRLRSIQALGYGTGAGRRRRSALPLPDPTAPVAILRSRREDALS